MILCIIQARMGSTRLPGKVLMDIAGRPMLDWVVLAAEQSKVDYVIIATTMNREDDILAEEYDVLRHSRKLRNGRNDVLARYYYVASVFEPEHVMRLTGDCPLARPDVMDAVIDLHLQNGYDFTHSERAEGGWPNGTGAEIMTFAALEQAHIEATDLYDREHVTSYFYRNPDKFNVGFYPCPYNASGKFSVDTEEDLKQVRQIIGRWGRCFTGPIM